MHNIMKEKIEEIIKSIDAEKILLIQELTKDFESLVNIPGTAIQHRNSVATSTGKTPGMVYILYVLAVIFFIVALTSESTFVCLILAVLCGWGGYKFSKKNTLPSNEVAAPRIDLNTVKSNASSKGIEAVKRITGEWNEFMGKNQDKVYAIIDSSYQHEQEKDELTSKIFSYEVIDINLSELMILINSASSIGDIKQKLDAYKSKFIKAIESASYNQKNKYNSLIESTI